MNIEWFRMALVFFAALSSMLVASPAGAQGPAPLANPDLDINDVVRAAVRLPDGGMIIGGSFTAINGVDRHHLARLRPDGTLDPDWDQGANGVVRALVITASGELFVGGNFDVIGGVVRIGIAKLSGTNLLVDPSWNAGANSVVFSLAVGAGDDLFVGGGFSAIGGEMRSFLAKLDGAHATADAAWNPSPDNMVAAIVVDGLGSVFVGGAFTTIDGQSIEDVAKLSVAGGAADSAWSHGTNGYIEALALDDAGHLFVGGLFSTIGGVPRSNLAKLSTEGSAPADSQWNPSPNGTVYALAVTGDDAVYAGGDFQTIRGQSNSKLGKLLRSGSGTSDPFWRPVPNGGVTFLSASNDFTLLVGGAFSAIGGQPRAHFAALPAASLPETIFASGFDLPAP